MGIDAGSCLLWAGLLLWQELLGCIINLANYKLVNKCGAVDHATDRRTGRLVAKFRTPIKLIIEKGRSSR